MRSLRQIIREETHFRTGLGFDVHQLTAGRPLIIGGENIAYEYGLEGHSDADVLTHAIMDALLGAAALGDIGQHFPDTDDQWKGANSLHLAAAVADLLRKHGYVIENVDAIIMAQRPKMAPHIPNMADNLARALGISPENVGVKATTTEKLGFVGRMEGIAASASALLRKIRH